MSHATLAPVAPVTAPAAPPSVSAPAGPPPLAGLAPARREALFGQGLAEPYARALKRGTGPLTLRAAEPGTSQEAVVFDVQEWCAPATGLERSLLGALNGPLLDIGCGPGRLLVAAQELGITALGLDASAHAVDQARSRGARALHQSVFAPVPQEGRWHCAVLLDGNIGIGGNARILLRRCAELLTMQGTLLVEVDPDDGADTAFKAVMEDGAGNVSEPFGWARVGLKALEVYAERSGWQVVRVQRIQGRVFCRLTRRTAALSTR